MAQRESYLTPDGLKRLRQELAHLKSVRRNEVAERIHKANETGGTVDNAEYDDAKNEQSFVEGRIRDVENILANAIVAPRRSKATGLVAIGSSVTVETARGSRQSYKVVGSAEAAPLEGKISNESPVGGAILGHKVGDKVEVTTPAGVVTLTITRIS